MNWQRKKWPIASKQMTLTEWRRLIWFIKKMHMFFVHCFNLTKIFFYVEFDRSIGFAFWNLKRMGSVIFFFVLILIAWISCIQIVSIWNLTLYMNKDVLKGRKKNYHTSQYICHLNTHFACFVECSILLLTNLINLS